MQLTLDRVATGYGQPGLTMFDWTLSSNRSTDPNFQLPSELKYRLDIEKFCDKVSKSLYSNPRDPVGLLTDEERFITTSILSRDFAELEGQLHSVNNRKSCPAHTNLHMLTCTSCNECLSSSCKSPSASISLLRQSHGKGLSPFTFYTLHLRNVVFRKCARP